MIAVALAFALFVVWFVRADQRDRARMRQQTKTQCPDCNRGVCRFCGADIDPETCYCGEPIPGYHDNHNPVPMGCICHKQREENAWDSD